MRIRLWLAIAVLAPFAAADPATIAKRAFVKSLEAPNPRYECVTLHGIRVDRVDVHGDDATVALTVDATAELPLSRAPREYPPHWIVELHHGIVRGMRVPEAAFARELASMADPQRALNERSELVDAELARQLCDLAFATMWKSDYPAAAREGALALQVAQEAAPSELPRAWWIVGRVRNLTHDEEGQKQPIADAITLAAKWNDHEIEARALILDGWSHAMRWEPEPAIASFEKGLHIADALHDDHIAEEGDLGLGFTMFTVKDDYVHSIPYFEKAIARSERAGDPVIEAAALANLAIVYDRMGNDVQAIRYMPRAIALYRAAGNVKGVMRNLRNLAEMEVAFRAYANAERHVRELAAMLVKSPDPRIAAYKDLTWSKILLQRKRIADADARSAAALEQAKTLHDEMMITLVGYTRMSVRFEQHRYADVLAMATDLVQRSLATTPNFDIYWETKLMAGRALEKLGRIDEARASFEEAVESIESRRSNVPGSGEDEQLFFDDKTPPYLALFDLAARRHDAADAVRWMERARARTLIESLAVGKMKSAQSLTPAELREEADADAKLKELNIALRDAEGERRRTLEQQVDAARLDRDEVMSRLYSRHPELSLARGRIPFPDLDEIRRSVPPDGVVLEYLVDADQSWLVTITRDAPPRFQRIAIGKGRLGDRVDAFRDSIASRDFGYRPEARKLYDLLVAPAAAVLRRKKIVCIIPHGSLWTLPFQALLDADGRSLIERHPLFYTPSLTILAWYRQHSRNTSGKRSLLAAGTGLTDAEREVRAIATFFDPSERLVLTGREATETRVKREASHYRILHFATHGTFSNELAMYSHIALARNKPDPDDGQLEAREIAALNLDADLVVLSSCNTARGGVRIGEGMVGMSWALLAAGCPRAVATQWEIGSSSAGDLMIDFHRRLAAVRPFSGRAATEALRKAQLHLGKNGEPAPHPFYWAGFILIGYGWQ